tara:strand:- start:219 stop:428 length:210 start_codon:yes stop_codon:yes gene_type:complete
MNYNKGDLVIVCTGRDEGDIGIVIGKVAWYDGAHKMLVVLSEGKKKTWYVEHVRLTNEEDRLSKGKGRP